MMMKENGVQFQISRSITVGSAMLGLVSHMGLNSMPVMRVIRSLMGPLWYKSISPV